ncbi:hypothetical protein EMIHUDRAFT_236936 [Emiliania huxleyi CCMP1516]|uniref:Major facilitator superfamily (MFS) profile domain-containing protein n=2 Tax=Emiliania huxleyi TaxID=2903 RepID=A0A0D3JRU3_EMIH1|nr:hypothetical protein EMIHUDRAFT_236936 [Emiliania huxleyi CCMP1516]EOD26228.1 hypothetical protein EMIHUDRAFT_236936 [Emiliania huxleyi CCMP1516]|eukprot:XP_005778657.1 hypothetical protein EMIHUDRAFT_236936 [Emiliania huxleyi CCMP1516]
MRNALVFSASFAILEGCISATIIISHEVVEHHLASSVSAVLYLFFALGTLVAPALVRRAGVKRSLVASMLMYAVYTAAYMAPSPTVLYPAGALGGLAGALLWTAQGAYYTTSAAGLFALFFQLSLTFGKQLAGLSLSLFPQALQLLGSSESHHRRRDAAHSAPPSFPQAPQLLFGAYTALALGCTVAMSSVIDLSARPGERQSDTGPGQPQGSGGEGSLLATLCDHRFVLLTPTNVAFGLMTALSSGP